jgi:hypothetical protein
MNTHISNYLHRRITVNERARHDQAFLRTLIALIAICILAAIVGKASGQSSTTLTSAGGQSAPEAHGASAAAKPESAKAKAEPIKAEPAKPKPASAAVPAPAPKPAYQPSAEDAKDGRILQLEAITAQQSWNADAMKLPSYQPFNASVNAANNWCRRMVAKYGWPADVQCNLNANPITFEKVQEQASQVNQPPVQAQQPAAKK